MGIYTRRKLDTIYVRDRSALETLESHNKAYFRECLLSLFKRYRTRCQVHYFTDAKQAWYEPGERVGDWFRCDRQDHYRVQTNGSIAWIATELSK